MSLPKCFCGRVLFALAISVLLLSSVAPAQEAPTPKFDVFGGSSWEDPSASLAGQKLRSASAGGAGTFTYNFTNIFGLSVDGAGHSDGNNEIYTVMAGPRLMWRQEHFQPYLHTLLGLNHLKSDGIFAGDPSRNGIGALLGGGFDIPITPRFSWKLIEANYLWAHQNFRPLATNTTNLGGVDLRTGIVINFGLAPPLPPMAASCSAAQPSEVMAGEPVSVSATVANIPPKHTVNYSWTSTGGKVTPNGNAASVDTTGLGPGNYTVTATATDPKPRKNQGPVSCTATFTVKEPPKNPPVLTCSANPSTVRAGEPSTITVQGTSPDKVRITNLSWQSSGGRSTGQGNIQAGANVGEFTATGTLDTAGAPAGPITVTATATDERGLTGSCTATVNVEVPPPPPQASKLSECQFPNKVKPWRVDNTCKAILDDVALRMQREPDSKLVIVGQADPDEKEATRLAAERAINSKSYLSGGEAKQAIDPSRIEVRTGTGGGRRAEYYIVPAGATFSEAGTTVVNESSVNVRTDKHPAPKKKAAPKTTPQG